jgi:hypothetical protein
MSEKKENFSLNITALFGILISVSYAFGYLYDQGYLNVYGLSPEYFTRTTADYIFKFFYVFLLAVVGIFKISFENIGYLLLCAVVAMLFFLLLQNKNKENRLPNKLVKIIEKIKLNNRVFNAVKSLVFLIYFIFTGVLGMYLILSLTIILWSPLMVGKKDAMKEMNTFSGCTLGELKPYSCVYVYREKAMMLSGSLIAKSDKNIAIWNGNKAVVYPLDNEIIIIEKAMKKKQKITNNLDTGDTE